MILSHKLKKENIFIADSFPDTDSFYSDFSQFLAERRIIEDPQRVKRLFVERENLMSTGIKKGAAAPHIFSDDFSEFVFSLALIRQGLDFKSPDQQDVYLVFLIMSDQRDAGLHLKCLARIARLVGTTDIVEQAKGAADQEEIHGIFAASEKMI